MNPKDNIAGHISKLHNFRQLKQLGELISESMLITNILITLPDSYRNFYSGWNSMNSENKLTIRLMVEETHKSARTFIGVHIQQGADCGHYDKANSTKAVQ